MLPVAGRRVHNHQRRSHRRTAEAGRGTRTPNRWTVSFAAARAVIVSHTCQEKAEDQVAHGECPPFRRFRAKGPCIGSRAEGRFEGVLAFRVIFPARPAPWKLGEPHE